MFENQRYITRGVTAEIDPVVQLAVFTMIDAMLVKQKDYLQVFDLKPDIKDGVTVQRITHTQEQPPYRQELVTRCQNPVHQKMFCIDDGDHSTLLLAEEY